MSVAWEALCSRARGLSAHLLAEEQIGRLERTDTATELTQRLRETAYGRLLPQGRDVGTGAVETALARAFAERMGTLARWAGGDGVALAPLFLEQDARNVRQVLRGLAGAQAPDRRLADALPTPSLGRKALEHLSRLDSAGSVAGALAAWGHPLGSPLLEEAGRTHVDLFRLEVALDRALARGASAAAGPGGRTMRRYVSRSIDARNALAALVLVTSNAETVPGDLFVEGGDRLSREAFERAAAARTLFESADVLRAALDGDVLARALVEPVTSPSTVASRMERARMEDLAGNARMDPLSPSPVLLFVLRARAEALRLRRALWAAALLGGAAA